MRIGFVGLGAIGEPMAERFADTDHELQVWNRTASRAAALADRHPNITHASSLGALAEASEAVITCLPTSAEVEACLAGTGGLAAGMASGSLLVDCTSGDPTSSRRIAERLRGQGVGFVDAPVSGGPPGARSGTLTVMCGGSASDVARARTVVAPFAGTVVALGPVGAGHAMKAVNNALLAVNILSVAEGMVALARAGVDPAVALGVLNTSSGKSFVTEALVPERVLTGSYPALFRLALLEKDVGIAHDVAQASGTADPVLGFVRECYRQLRADLGEDADYLDPFKVAEQAAGVELRG